MEETKSQCVRVSQLELELMFLKHLRANLSPRLKINIYYIIPLIYDTAYVH